jgi:FkbM family methyltransferase
MIKGTARSVANWLRGHPKLAGWALKVLPDIPVTITIPLIGRFRIRARRNRSFWLRDPLTHEGFPLAALRAFTRPGDVVYDIGANIGLYTRFCISAFQAGRVMAFEPMTDNCSQLRQNIEIGGIGDRVTVLPYALSDVDDIQDLQVDDVSSASAALAVVTNKQASHGRRHYGFAPKTERVTCHRLDSVLADDALPGPDVIKVDIEGAEDLFLVGAAECLTRFSPRLVVELHGADKARRVFDLLTGYGYSCAGNVAPTLAASSYCRLDAATMERVSEYFDVHFLIASKFEADLPRTIEFYHP